MYNFRRLLASPLKRFYSNATQSNKVLERLNERSLIRVSGPDVSEFLQGLLTNDIRHLQNGPGSMFTMLLNTKGRVMYDAILYRSADNTAYFLECDKDAIEPLLRHLKIYRVRRKIEMVDLTEHFNVNVLFDAAGIHVEHAKMGDDTLDGFIVPCDKLKEMSPRDTVTSTKMYKNLQIFRDPRVGLLGSRIIAETGADVAQQLSEIYSISTAPAGVNYRWFRYGLGVGEGAKDLPPGNCFPLECNCDYLHGVSFHKGCYIGQEVTARTHHTGVVRKRLMPLFFTKIPTKWPVDNTILHEGVNLGKLRGVEGNMGLGLIRIGKALEFNVISVGDGLAKVVKPHWWPIELSKEKVNIQKT